VVSPLNIDGHADDTIVIVIVIVAADHRKTPQS
jgi:hypothetical protein